MKNDDFLEQSKWFLAHSNFEDVEQICSNISSCDKCFIKNIYDNEFFCSPDQMIKDAKNYLRNEKLKRISK